VTTKPEDLPVAILAGGLATRLKPITETVPKLLVSVAGEPFFTHQIRLLKKSGLTHLVVCLGYLGEKVVDLYGDGSKWGVKIEYSFDGPKLLGTGGALIGALPKLGDYLAVGRSFLASGKLGLMTVFENSERYDASNVWFEGAEMRAYDKKAKVPAMRHIDYGLGVFRKAAFDGFPREAAVDLSDIQKALLERGQLAGFEIRERFFEVGSHSGLRELDSLLKKSG